MLIFFKFWSLEIIKHPDIFLVTRLSYNLFIDVHGIFFWIEIDFFLMIVFYTLKEFLHFTLC